MSADNLTTERRAKADLLALSMAVFSQAKFRLYVAIGLGVGATAVSLLSTFIPSTWQWVSLAAAAVAFVLAISSYVIFRSYEGRYDLTSAAKRLVLMEQGLGWVTPDATRTSILNRAGDRARANMATYKQEADTYYASEHPVGAARLLDLVQESAFFTWNLYQSLRDYLLLALIVVVSITGVLAWGFLVSEVPQDERVRFGQFVLAVIPAIISVGLVTWCFKLTDLFHAIERVDTALEHLRLGRKLNERDVLQLVDEYNTQIVQGLPVPTWLYKKRQAELNELWEHRRAKAGR